MASIWEAGEPEWTREPTEEPLSPELRAAVIEELKESWYFAEKEEYRRWLKFAWLCEDFHESIKDPNVLFEPHRVNRYLTAFYWMPSPQVDGNPLSSLPFGCMYKEWFRYHDGHPPIHFGDFFAHLVRVYPTGPTTIHEVITAHKSICQNAVSLLGRIERGEVERPEGLPRLDPQKYKVNPTYHDLLMMIDQYLEPDYADELIDIDEQAQRLTALLVRTGDDSHLCTPVNFDKLRTDGLCLPLARSDVPVNSDDVVRVSLATAVKFVSDLHQRELVAHPPSPEVQALRDWDKRAQRFADEKIKEADAKGIDSDLWTWSAVRRAKAARRGEVFQPREPYPFNRFWKWVDQDSQSADFQTTRYKSDTLWKPPRHSKSK